MCLARLWWAGESSLIIFFPVENPTIVTIGLEMRNVSLKKEYEGCSASAAKIGSCLKKVIYIMHYLDISKNWSKIEFF